MTIDLTPGELWALLLSKLATVIQLLALLQKESLPEKFPNDLDKLILS